MNDPADRCRGVCVCALDWQDAISWCDFLLSLVTNLNGNIQEHSG
jgi:hypothetical protein